MTIAGTLVRTCGACPEQYDIFSENGLTWGYIRLRNGVLSTEGAGGFSRNFNAITPENIGELQDVDPREIDLPQHSSDGVFGDGEVRDVYLSIIIERCLGLTPNSYYLKFGSVNDYGDSSYNIVLQERSHGGW